jgi:hypothetical protein
VFVASIPNLYQLWRLFRTDPAAQVVYFHPSLLGQATLAAETWRVSWWGS